MPRLTLALVCLALCTTPAASHARGASFKGPSHAGGLPRTLGAWAAAPRPYTLGTYSAPHGTPHTGTSTLRQQHIQRLQTCNPFAGVRAATPLSPC
jgi:hypothetical protein